MSEIRIIEGSSILNRVNELFMYDIDPVLPGEEPLASGWWAGIYFERSDDPSFPYEKGEFGKPRRLFCEGMDHLAQILAGTDALGVYGQTSLHEVLLRYAGFHVGRSENYGRLAYMSLAELLEKPWYARKNRRCDTEPA